MVLTGQLIASPARGVDAQGLFLSEGIHSLDPSMKQQGPSVIAVLQCSQIPAVTMGGGLWILTATKKKKMTYIMVNFRVGPSLPSNGERQKSNFIYN